MEANIKYLDQIDVNICEETAGKTSEKQSASIGHTWWWWQREDVRVMETSGVGNLHFIKTS